MDVNGGQAHLAHRRQWAEPAVAASRLTAGFGTWLGQAGLPFLLIAYLGLRGGGYDAIVRSEVGVAAWWIVLLGAGVGALPLARLSRPAWLALGLMATFAAWTGLGVAWSESAERSVAELGRVATLLGVFALALALQGRDGLRRMVGGLGAGIALVAGIALLSRLHPAWFPELEAPQFLPETQARLHYPLNYWNGLATFTAIGVPLLLVLATVARRVVTRALALAAVPALVLTAFFTLSRGGAIELAIAVAVLFALHPRRLGLLGPALVAGIGSAILIAAASQRDPLVDGLTTPTALAQGDEMLAMTLVVCAGVGLVATALALADRYELGPRIRIARRPAALATVTGAVVALTIALAAGLPGFASDTWDEFKGSSVSATGAERFESVSGNGRYEYWQTAVEAGKSEPLVGIGPGTYEYFWAREGTGGFVRDAHSLYLETFAELGLVGLALIVALIVVPFAVGARRLFALDRENRTVLAGALAACAAFAAAAAIDWSWELTVLPVAFLLLAAAVIGLPRLAADDQRARRPLAGRLALPVLAVAGAIAIAIPMAGAGAVRDSQSEVRAQDLGGALAEARTAADIEPYAASPSLQEALVLELRGETGAAAAAARTATEEEPTNWRTWLVLSRLEARAGNAEASVAAYREARSLNPRSSLFQ